MANKKVAISTPAPTLFDLEEVPQTEVVVFKQSYEDKAKEIKAKGYDWREIGINADYEKNGRITLFNNKLP